MPVCSKNNNGYVVERISATVALETDHAVIGQSYEFLNLAKVPFLIFNDFLISYFHEV